jgi:ABC-type multidrug transport system ATPase subunit
VRSVSVSAQRVTSAGLAAGTMAAAVHPVIEFDGLTKRYRARTAVDDLTVQVLPGRVTGFLGPNGSGKTTTMRCVLGLTRPTAGTATVLGVPYAELAQPMRRVGALIDPRAWVLAAALLVRRDV